MIIFSDVDGTLLNSKKEISFLTKSILKKTIDKKIPFVITSSRCIDSIYKIIEEYHLPSYVIAFGGALIVDDKKNTLYENKMEYSLVKSIIEFLDNNFDVAWNVYSSNKWIVKNKKDQRVITEEKISKVEAQEGDIFDIKDEIFKILCICHKEDTLFVEEQLKKNFPNCYIVKSSNALIEISNKDVNKAYAVKKLCQILNYNLQDAFAFGDNYNDLAMLQEVGHPFLMKNAPEDLKKIISNHTLSNDEDGIYFVLKDVIGD